VADQEGVSGEDLVKVHFALDQDEDGWPPVASEGLWARPIGPHEYELENVPWFARNVAYGDRWIAERDTDGLLWCRDRIAWSGRYTIRVIPLRDGALEGSLQEVIDRFSCLGADCEGALPAYGIVALDIPPDAALAEIKALLRDGTERGWWEYEEGCIDDRWLAL
jgi:hypothetical protein